MREARKCDRCGRHGVPKDFGKVAVNDKVYEPKWALRADLCGECYKKLIRWLDGEVEK